MFANMVNELNFAKIETSCFCILFFTIIINSNFEHTWKSIQAKLSFCYIIIDGKYNNRVHNKMHDTCMVA